MINVHELKVWVRSGTKRKTRCEEIVQVQSDEIKQKVYVWVIESKSTIKKTRGKH